MEFGGRQNGKTLATLLRLCDVIVDGPFVESQRDLTLKFRGSMNQRLIDVKATISSGRITELCN
jgi:anaerobic ribonucleoside-triphosphate reductase activating protein